MHHTAWSFFLPPHNPLYPITTQLHRCALHIEISYGLLIHRHLDKSWFSQFFNWEERGSAERRQCHTSIFLGAGRALKIIHAVFRTGMWRLCTWSMQITLEVVLENPQRSKTEKPTII
jgi:hypothetical protein